MRIALFALTGVGNAVLEVLRPDLVVTRQERGPFPHYPCENIAEVARRREVPLYFGAEGESVVSRSDWDLILVATYHRTLSQELLSRARHAVNLHPSLLPKYRGPVPTYWVLHNREPMTGVTAHAVTEELDKGDIFLQRATEILPDETEASLRKRLADISATMALEIVDLVSKGNLVGTPQDESLASTYGRP